MKDQLIYKIADLGTTVKIPAWGTDPGQEGLANLIGKIVGIFLIVVSVVGLVGIIMGGYLYITSAGNPEQATKGKNSILYSLMGMIIAWGAYAIIYYIVQGLFGS